MLGGRLSGSDERLRGAESARPWTCDPFVDSGAPSACAPQAGEGALVTEPRIFALSASHGAFASFGPRAFAVVSFLEDECAQTFSQLSASAMRAGRASPNCSAQRRESARRFPFCFFGLRVGEPVLFPLALFRGSLPRRASRSSPPETLRSAFRMRSHQLPSDAACRIMRAAVLVSLHNRARSAALTDAASCASIIRVRIRVGAAPISLSLSGDAGGPYKAMKILISIAIPRLQFVKSCDIFRKSREKHAKLCQISVERRVVSYKRSFVSSSRGGETRGRVRRRR